MFVVVGIFSIPSFCRILPLYFDRRLNSRTAKNPSAMANGICVKAYMPKNVENAVKTLPLSGNARPSWNAVMTYVIKSAMAVAAKTPIIGIIPAFLDIFHMAKPIAGPAMPMEKMLAPRVVMPP